MSREANRFLLNLVQQSWFGGYSEGGLASQVWYSGNLTPSEADIRLTRKLKEAGETLDLPVLDHLILSSEGFYSFADKGML